VQTRGRRLTRKLVILGAGFDAPVGIPTMAGFFQKAWEFVGRELMGDNLGFESFPDEDIEHFMRVRHSWQTWRSKPETVSAINLEEFAIFVEEHQPDRMSDLRYVITRTFELARRVWVLRHEHCPGHPDWEPVYRAFARDVLARRNEVAVLSFNYSPIFEQALRQEGGRPEYRLQHVCANDDITTDGCPTVEVIKPHGSMSWFVPVDTDPVVIYVRTPGNVEMQNAPWSGPANWESGWPQVGGDKRMALILPPSRKAGQKPERLNGRLGAERRLLEPVWEHLKRILPGIESCFIAGWSAPMTDTYVFDHLSCLKQKCTRVSVLNKNAEERTGLESRYRKFLPENVNFDPEPDFGGMRAADDMPLWKCFLES